jgi:hypothetical protein
MRHGSWNYNITASCKFSTAYILNFNKHKNRFTLCAFFASNYGRNGDSSNAALDLFIGLGKSSFQMRVTVTVISEWLNELKANVATLLFWIDRWSQSYPEKLEKTYKKWVGETLNSDIKVKICSVPTSLGWGCLPIKSNNADKWLLTTKRVLTKCTLKPPTALVKKIIYATC